MSNQPGARLTAFELVHDGLPATLICDSMAGALMAEGKVDAVVLGADRVSENGDTANKIGTLSLAILAHHYKIPFFVAAPSTSIDLSIKVLETPPAIRMLLESSQEIDRGEMRFDLYCSEWFRNRH